MQNSKEPEFKDYKADLMRYLPSLDFLRPRRAKVKLKINISDMLDPDYDSDQDGDLMIIRKRSCRILNSIMIPPQSNSYR